MINPGFTRGEYWLLEEVVEAATPISWLASENLEETLNKTGHGMSRMLLVETMLGLFKEGLITAHHSNQWENCFALTSGQIESALDEELDDKVHYERAHYYRLTPKCYVPQKISEFVSN